MLLKQFRFLNGRAYGIGKPLQFVRADNIGRHQVNQLAERPNSHTLIYEKLLHGGHIHGAAGFDYADGTDDAHVGYVFMHGKRR